MLQTSINLRRNMPHGIWLLGSYGHCCSSIHGKYLVLRLLQQQQPTLLMNRSHAAIAACFCANLLSKVSSFSSLLCSIRYDRRCVLVVVNDYNKLFFCSRSCHHTQCATAVKRGENSNLHHMPFHCHQIFTKASGNSASGYLSFRSASILLPQTHSRSSVNLAVWTALGYCTTCSHRRSSLGPEATCRWFA